MSPSVVRLSFSKTRNFLPLPRGRFGFQFNTILLKCILIIRKVNKGFVQCGFSHRAAKLAFSRGATCVGYPFEGDDRIMPRAWANGLTSPLWSCRWGNRTTGDPRSKKASVLHPKCRLRHQSLTGFPGISKPIPGRIFRSTARRCR